MSHNYMAHRPLLFWAVPRGACLWRFVARNFSDGNHGQETIFVPATVQESNRLQRENLPGQRTSPARQNGRGGDLSYSRFSNEKATADGRIQNIRTLPAVALGPVLAGPPLKEMN